ncbi:hypothetical protein B296_00004203 [Ensete ventricosum]|uniref:Uncharacterized protein n=1 Tax=Ensete ventricosum TaxID=4639 RepID=A0A426XVZ1_ENSVE|nr:hypothetical protein B296_00004203 [Ensete ventricosum]
MESIYLLPIDRHPWHRRRCHRRGGRCPQPLVTLRRRQRLLTQCRETSASSAAAVRPPLSTTEVPLLLASSSLVRDGPNPISSPPCCILMHEAVFLVHHHCRISSNEERHLPYPICNRQRLLHLLAGAVPPTASVALFSLLRAPVRAIAYRLSVLCREGTTSSFSLSNDIKSTTANLRPQCFSRCPSDSSATIFLSSSTGKVALAASPRYCHDLACLSPATHHHSPSPLSLSEAPLLPAVVVASSRALYHCHRCCHAAAPLSPAIALVVPL